MALSNCDRLEIIQEATDHALSYVGQHGREGRWSYDLMREALVKINSTLETPGPFAEDMKDDRYDEA